MPDCLSIQGYLIPFFFSFAVAVFLTYLVKKLAERLKIYDRPEKDLKRKIHTRPVPLLGGMAVFFSISLAISYYTFFTDRVLGGYMQLKYIIGILVGGFILMVGGYLDDKYNLKPQQQIVFPILSSLAVIACGIGISYISNPFGGVIDLSLVKLKIFALGGLPYYFVLFADIFSFFWLMGMMYTTKFLDGLDGLVSGISVIGSLVLFFMSLNKEVAQPETALLAIIVAGSFLGFLMFNFYPAKIFLGEGGSLLAGFLLASLSIISGAKIATALMVMGIPILDVVWVIVRRAFFEKRSPFRNADKKHLHFRLLDAGFSHRQSVVLLYVISLVFGGLSLVLHGISKAAALVVLFVLMLILGFFVVRRCHKRGVIN